MKLQILRQPPGVAVVAAPVFALTASAVSGDPYGGWSNGYGNMMWGGGLFAGLMMLVFWGGIIALIFLTVRALSDRSGGGGGAGKAGQSGVPDAMAILRERLARGEIDAEEFEARCKALKAHEG